VQCEETGQNHEIRKSSRERAATLAIRKTGDTRHTGHRNIQLIWCCTLEPTYEIIIIIIIMTMMMMMIIIIISK